MQTHRCLLPHERRLSLTTDEFDLGFDNPRVAARQDITGRPTGLIDIPHDARDPASKRMSIAPESDFGRLTWPDPSSDHLVDFSNGNRLVYIAQREQSLFGKRRAGPSKDREDRAVDRSTHDGPVAFRRRRSQPRFGFCDLCGGDPIVDRPCFRHRPERRTRDVDSFLRATDCQSALFELVGGNEATVVQLLCPFELRLRPL